MEHKLYNYKCKLIRVVDGDTIEAMIDLGFHTFTRRFIDLTNVDASEIRTKDTEEKIRGFKHKEMLESWITDTFYLESNEYDAFGRSKGNIINDKGNIINQIMVHNISNTKEK
jgi:micrococcal nuclease